MQKLHLDEFLRDMRARCSDIALTTLLLQTPKEAVVAEHGVCGDQHDQFDEKPEPDLRDRSGGHSRDPGRRADDLQPTRPFARLLMFFVTLCLCHID